jgi:gamma-glutamylcyclotransferase (GGCT)/AIG2-like uncharacterized protein YtfP
MIPRLARAGDCHRLFVYGTLRRGFRLHHHLVRLGARFRTEAKVAADLFDLGRYPGARPVSGKRKWVRGEMFQLRQPSHDLRILDKVEYFIPAAPAQSEFVCAVTEVILPNGARQSAWIYWLAAQAGGNRRRIVCGDYAAWRARRAVI